MIANEGVCVLEREREELVLRRKMQGSVGKSGGRKGEEDGNR